MPRSIDSSSSTVSSSDHCTCCRRRFTRSALAGATFWLLTTPNPFSVSTRSRCAIASLYAVRHTIRLHRFSSCKSFSRSLYRSPPSSDFTDASPSLNCSAIRSNSVSSGITALGT
ncbi:MAG: hypothetical protein KBT13_01920 [Bacteroidales bacterium]|nr:hypothetical protein [Candidatus Sodaliphilus limicaballi]